MIDNQLVILRHPLFWLRNGNLPNGGCVFVLTLDGKQSRGIITK